MESGVARWSWERRVPFFSIDDVIDGWDALAQWPGAETLKSNLLRQVVALPATSLRAAVVIKRYHFDRGVDRVKALIWRSRARSEWDALLHLESCGVRVPRALAMGEAWSGATIEAAGLVLERIADVDPLPVWLEGRDGEFRRAALRSAGRELARLHDAGCDHTDLHGGNLLVSRYPGASGEPDVTLIDHHVIKIFAHVPAWRRMRNLAKWVHSMRPLVSYPELIEFVEAYRETTRGFAPQRTTAEVIEELEAHARALESIRLRSRSRRCWKTSSEFVRETRGDWQVYRRRSFDSDKLAPLLEGGLALDPVFKERRRSRVGVVALSGPGLTEAVVKERTPVGWKGFVERWIGGPLERAWGVGRALDVRGVENPATLALALRRGIGPPRAILLTERADGAETLHSDLLARLWPPGVADAPAHEIEQLAEWVRTLHDTGIYHRDLNPGNVLVTRSSGEGERDELAFSLIDLDSVVPGRRLTDRRRRRNLVQLGLVPEGHLHPRDRLRFLRAYDRGEGRYYNREWIRALDRELAAETIHILARMSRQGTVAEIPESIGDPRFVRPRPGDAPPRGYEAT